MLTCIDYIDLMNHHQTETVVNVRLS